MPPQDDEPLEGTFRADDLPPENSLVVPTPAERVVFVPVERVVERRVIVERPVYRSAPPRRRFRIAAALRPLLLMFLLACVGGLLYAMAVLLRIF